MNYYLAATALRAFSATQPTKALYRWLGNLKGSRQLSEERAGWVLACLAEAPMTAPNRFLELGTGWMHAYSLYPALLYDAEVHCFDVWDNRSYKAFRNALPQVRSGLSDMALDPDRRQKALARLAEVDAAEDFETAYKPLNLHYAIDHHGALPYPDAHFDMLYSVDVLEHVVASGFDSNAADWFRVTKPGGRMVAQVGLDDHLAHYDPSRSKKHYLRHSDGTFRNWLENDVQYINRLPADAILAKLEAAGFRVLQAERFRVEERPPVHADYAGQSDDDIMTWRLHLTVERPA
ncbi:MAG: methyltransferase domain-containing protein [Minwuia sp.]|nr:methyltransferase domain-containing protein [Minwuia sp.]